MKIFFSLFTVMILTFATPLFAADHAPHGSRAAAESAAPMTMKEHMSMKHPMASPEEMRKRSLTWMPKAHARIGEKLDPELTYIDTEGKTKRLGDLFDKPLFVNFIFASCPHACPLITSNFGRAAHVASSKNIGDFRLLTLSFDPQTDTPEVMKAYGEGYSSDYAHWIFGASPVASVKKLNDAFGHSYMPHPDEVWAHMNMVTAVAPGGVIIKQIFGLRVKQDEFETALRGLLAP